MDRDKLILKTAKVSFVTQLLIMILSFVTRKVVIQFVGVEYLGINSVLSDILSMLSLSELGFQTAITYRLYKPLSENDYNTINQIMSLLKRIYYIVGSMIISVGCFMMPILKYIITDISIPWHEVYIFYMVLLLSSSLPYFIGYKRTLLFADQKQFIISLIDAITNIIFSIIKITIIVIVKNYILFILIQLFQNLIANIVLNVYCNNKYDYLSKEKVPGLLKEEIVKDTKNIFAAKIANFVYSSTDNIIISMFISTVMVGMIGNYKTLFNAITIVISSIVIGFRPAIGNTVIEKSVNDNWSFFCKYSYIRFFLTAAFLIPAMSLMDLFISLWYGTTFVLNKSILILITVDLYISIIHGPTGEYVEVLGYFKEAKIVSIIGTVINLVGSILGAMFWGIEGVLLATIISQIVMWVGRGRILFGKYFSYHKLIEYLYKQIEYIVIYIGTTIIIMLLLTDMLRYSWVAFFVSGLIIEVAVLTVLIIHKNIYKIVIILKNLIRLIYH